MDEKTISMEQLLNKIEDNACRRHMRVHDSKGNKEYWREYSKALNKDMRDLEGWCEKEDWESYVEYLNDKE